MKRIARAFVIVLSIMTGLTGCGYGGQSKGFIEMYLPDETKMPEPLAETASAAPSKNKTMTLYYESREPLNPVFTTSAINSRLSGLLYEGLFKVNPDFSYEPVLCESWETTDGQSYRFVFKKGVKFHDGTEMSIFDVVSSINIARESDRFSDRLSVISEVYADGGDVCVYLEYPNTAFPALLDIPVLKESTRYDENPLGTGPYSLVLSESTARLSAFLSHRDYNLLNALTINLRDYRSELLVSDFESQAVDIVVTNKSEFGFVEFTSNNEKRIVETTKMHFLGFNSSRGFCASGARRLILSSIIDRAYMSTTILDGTLPAVLPIHPNSAYFRQDIAETALIGESFLEEYLVRSMVDDYDFDGFMEYVEDGKVWDVVLELIVNSENLKKVAAAKYAASVLTEAGFNVVLKELTWDLFIDALENGDYDIYYGEIKLTPDFDLSSVLCAGGSANYGVYDSILQSYVYAFNAAGVSSASGNNADSAEEDAAAKGDSEDTQTDETNAEGEDTEGGETFSGDNASAVNDEDAANSDEKILAAAALLRYFCDTAPIAPLLFERQTVFTHRGMISDMIPTQQNLFYNVSDWIIK